jgi:hypothetical protein
MSWVSLPSLSEPFSTSWGDKARKALSSARAEAAPSRGPYAVHIMAGRASKQRLGLGHIVEGVISVLDASWDIGRGDCQAIEAKWVAGLQGIRVLVLPTTKVPA